MKRTQLNIHRMYDAVMGVFKKYPAAVSAIVALFNTVQQFFNLVDQIKKTEKTQGANLVGFTEDKNISKEKCAKKAASVSGCLCAWAAANSHRDIIRQVGYSQLRLLRFPDDVFIEKCNLIYELANDNLNDLAPYSIDVAYMGGYQAQITAFVDSYEGMLTARSSRTGSTGELAVLYHETSRLLSEELDKIMERAEEVDKEFYNVYQKARVIYDYKGHPSKTEENQAVTDHFAVLSGFVYDSVSGDPVEGANIEILGTDLKTDTDPDSEFNFESVKPGTYILRISADGFITQDVPNVIINADDEVALEFIINPVTSNPEPDVQFPDSGSGE
ncbi:MAG: carboxypeptidase-like regulatory domain-containing protein [Bacteroidota bacterium]